jgi:restriction system protein
MDTSPIWIMRAGRHGEDEETALDKDLAIIGFREFPDLTQFGSQEDIFEYHQKKIEPGARELRSRVFAQQLWTFREVVQPGDLAVLPLKTRRGQMAIGRVKGPYRFRDVGGQSRHTREVDWTHPDLPRSSFRQDLLHSFGAFITVCRVKRNNAERRVQEVLQGRPDPGAPAETERESVVEEAESSTERLDLELAATDEISAFIHERFPNHTMARLVEAVLQAQGFKTMRSPPGADGGVDILGGSGPLGLDPPFLCVQVKATQAPSDVKVFRELAGSMVAFKATQGLLVSWGGFTQPVIRESRQETFKIRLWDQTDLVKAIHDTYDRLDPEIQAELPLKRVWMLVHEEDEGSE